MVTKMTDAAKQITYLAGALKAPRITEAAARLADQARDAGWSFEDYLAAVLEREVSARNASGAELRIKAAGFPARKTDISPSPPMPSDIGDFRLSRTPQPPARGCGRSKAPAVMEPD